MQACAGAAIAGPDQCTGEAEMREELLPVEQMQFLAGLEADCFARRDTHLGAGTRIAPNAGFARPNIEDAEAAQFDSLPFGKRSFQGFEDRVHRRFSLIPLQPGTLNHLMNNVLFNQCLPPSGRSSDLIVIVETFSCIVNAAALP